jgi:hypothetical protein
MGNLVYLGFAYSYGSGFVYELLTKLCSYSFLHFFAANFDILMVLTLL